MMRILTTLVMMMMASSRAQFSPGAAQEARIVNNGGGGNLRPVLLADHDLSDFELFEVRIQFLITQLVNTRLSAITHYNMKTGSL